MAQLGSGVKDSLLLKNMFVLLIVFQVYILSKDKMSSFQDICTLFSHPIIHILVNEILNKLVLSNPSHLM